MLPDKTLSFDGFDVEFYHRFLDICGKDVFHACCFWIRAGAFPLLLMILSFLLFPKLIILKV